MAARYALVSFWWHNTSTNRDEYVHLGALRDSTAAAVTQRPEMFTPAAPDPLVTDPKLYGYLKNHPGGPGE